MSAPLKTGAAPLGIVSLELAGDVPRAREIMASWDISARNAAIYSVRLDFLFLLAYSTTISLACMASADSFRARKRRGATVGELLVWGQWLAALLDAVENIALLRMLREPVREPWPQIARWFATLKFVLISAGLTYVAISVVVRLLRGPNKPR